MSVRVAMWQPPITQCFQVGDFRVQIHTYCITHENYNKWPIRDIPQWDTQHVTVLIIKSYSWLWWKARRGEWADGQRTDILYGSSLSGRLVMAWQFNGKTSPWNEKKIRKLSTRIKTTCRGVKYGIIGLPLLRVLLFDQVTIRSPQGIQHNYDVHYMN